MIYISSFLTNNITAGFCACKFIHGLSQQRLFLNSNYVMNLERAHSSKSTMTRAMKLHLSIANRGTHNRQIFQNQRRSDTMNQLPQHSYFGQYYFNPQWVQATGSGSPSVVYNNVVNFSVGPDGTHYFHQTYSGQFVAPSASTVDMKMVRQLHNILFSIGVKYCMGFCLLVFL